MLQVTQSSPRPRPRLVRLLLLATAATAASSLVPGVAHADVARTGATRPDLAPVALPLAPPPARDEDRPGDHLTVTVRNAGAGRDGTYQLYCHPGSGDHPDVAGACASLDRRTRWGTDTFAPVPGGSICTMQYGGPATAHVTGVWAGRRVDASYDRSDGCQIGRWDRLVPLLPDLRPHGQS
ncbi:SSI family serine proteinase inhibitor [Streptomyces sp. CA-249302]|uniref:SSI family serine proteinase inhibitor n=1 Tax=Streptomyces sp. CA-249302 TaxID=3240058 RepID=UPI003D8D0F32